VHAELDGLDAADPEEASEALPAALAPLSELSTLPPLTADLDPDTPLGRAAAEAPSCRAIRTDAP
jgi:hypothetical protein